MQDFDDLFLQADNLRNNAQVDEAIKAYTDIANLAEQEGKLPEQARATHMAGVSAKESVSPSQGAYYQQAKTFLEQAVKLFQELDDTASLSAVYRDMGIVADYAEDHDQALINFQKSIEHFNQTDDPGGLAITYDKLGLHFMKVGQNEAAIQHIDRALQLFRKDPTAGFFKATTLFDKARVLTKMGQFDQAYDLATESLSWFEADHGETKYDRRLAQLHGLLFLILAKMNRDDEAKKHLQIRDQIMKSFDPLAAAVLQHDLEELT